MYKFYYNEVLDESPKEAREQERSALERSIALLQEAEQPAAEAQGRPRVGGIVGDA